jgi:hypothetical protein
MTRSILAAPAAPCQRRVPVAGPPGLSNTRERVAFETRAARLWKRLSREERLAAASRFFEQPSTDAVGSADAAIIKARRLRPQVARALPPEEKARVLSTVLDLDETLAGALAVALHLGERRPLLVAFLDALGLAHEDGILKEEAEADMPPLAEEPARRAVLALAGSFPRTQLLTYLNVLLLQDPERWRALERAPDWLP